MKKTKFYKDESVNIFLIGMFIVGAMMTIGLISLRISKPEGWAPNGFLAAMGFMTIWLTIIGIFWYIQFTKTKAFIKRRDNIINNGKKLSGIISDTKDELSYSSDGDGNRRVTHNYFIKVTFVDNEKQTDFWTPQLAFNPKRLTATDVDIYSHNGEHYVDNFKIK